MPYFMIFLVLGIHLTNDNIDRMAAASEKENTVAFYLIPILGIFLLVAVVLLVVCLFKRFNPKLFN